MHVIVGIEYLSSMVAVTVKTEDISIFRDLRAQTKMLFCGRDLQAEQSASENSPQRVGTVVQFPAVLLLLSLPYRISYLLYLLTVFEHCNINLIFNV